MKLKNVFKALGLTLFLVALVIFMLSQNDKVHPDTVLFPVAFGSVLAFSGGCLIIGELIAKIEKLEERAFWLEEEVRKLKEKSNNKE
ncbi:MAG: hypothetical protein E7598_00595 [Ruminococcaceae bacterium]|nr:hypothetical protein [Oscillospiraceae bacterium]